MRAVVQLLRRQVERWVLLRIVRRWKLGAPAWQERDFAQLRTNKQTLRISK
jgi:hypothetical protein